MVPPLPLLWALFCSSNLCFTLGSFAQPNCALVRSNSGVLYLVRHTWPYCYSLGKGISVLNIWHGYMCLLKSPKSQFFQQSCHIHLKRLHLCFAQLVATYVCLGFRFCHCLKLSCTGSIACWNQMPHAHCNTIHSGSCLSSVWPPLLN